MRRAARSRARRTSRSARTGRHAYVASYGSHGIAVFRRERRTGHLEQLPGRRGCVRHEGGEFCRAGRAMGGPVSIAVSADGRNVYVASAGSDALSIFSRNQRTGVLTQLPGGSGCVSQRPGGGCGGPGPERADQRGREPRRCPRLRDGEALPEWPGGVRPRCRRRRCPRLPARPCVTHGAAECAARALASPRR